MMKFIKTIFWNDSENRLRAFFRIVLLILLAGIFANIISLVANNFNELLGKSAMNFLIMLAIVVSIYLVGKYIDKREWTGFGISILPIKQFMYGGLMGASLVSGIFLLQYLLGWLTIDEIKYNQFSYYPFWLVFIGQVFRYVCGSIFEEAFSRSYLLINIAEGLNGKFKKDKSVIISYILTSSIFGLLHFANKNASWLSSFNLILIGLLFGWVVVKTGKLHFAIGLHAFWNIFQNNVFGFANSGKSSIVSVFTFQNSGNTLWTGGEFGIEGGLICTIITLATLLVLSYSKIIGKKKFEQKVLK